MQLNKINQLVTKLLPVIILLSKLYLLITLFLKSIILILADFLVVIWARDGHDTNFASLEILESPEASPRVNFILGDFLLVK